MRIRVLGALRPRTASALFLDGSYIPLDVRGRHAGRVIAFARKLDDSWAVAVAPIRMAAFVNEGEFPVGESIWGDTAVELPEGHPPVLKNIFTAGIVRASGARLRLADVCSGFPVGLLIAAEG